MDTIHRRTTPPNEPGIYWYQDEEIIRCWDARAFYTCIVVKAGDKAALLFTGHNQNQQIKTENGEWMAHFNYPNHHCEMIADLRGTWWGPLPNPDL